MAQTKHGFSNTSSLTTEPRHPPKKHVASCSQPRLETGSHQPMQMKDQLQFAQSQVYHHQAAESPPLKHHGNTEKPTGELTCGG